MALATRPTKRGGYLGGNKPSGVCMNHKDLRSVKEVALSNYDAEYMYLRENELTQFDADVNLDYLRVLDLSINDIGGSVDFLSKTPRLHHLYMTGNKIETLTGICNLKFLETLCLSDNAISSFEGLENLPSLRVLSLNFNNISTFEAFPILPCLHTLNLVGNLITEVPSYRSMAIAINCNDLVSIDGNPVQEEERAAIQHYRGKIALCIRMGFIVEGENVEEAADAFLLKAQRLRESSKVLQLCAIRLASTEEGSNVLMEGVPVALSLCMQDIRPFEVRTTEVFYSDNQLHPVIFQVSGEATEVFVVGSMNNWTDPIELERCEKDGEIYFNTTLYLPKGDYEYRYIVDGVEKVADADRITSKYKQGFCNLYQVTEREKTKETQETILYIRWMRSTAEDVFKIIENQNSLSYTPSIDDINSCLRAEVLAYINGEFSFLYFDVSSPIVAAPPCCTNLTIKGEAQEGHVLRAEAQYSGGVEGHSSLAWFRVNQNGEEISLDVHDPWAGFKLTRDDVGHSIRVVFTPVRNDWTAGEAKSQTTASVVSGPPDCESIKIIGNLIEGSHLEVDVVYTGGLEGASFYQWLHKVDGSPEEYIPIEGENSTKHLVTLADVGKCLAVEYTPMNSEGVEGETCRCVLEKPIVPTVPQVRNLVITGELCEGKTLAIGYDYTGGHFGAHMIQWFRCYPHAKKAPTKIGQTNSSYLTLGLMDVGCSIEVSMTPVRSDGARGQPVHVKTNGIVCAAKPYIAVLDIVGQNAPGEKLTLRSDYIGGKEGPSTIEWEIEDPETMIFDEVAHNTNHYTVGAEDAGKMLKVTYHPVREDGVEGQPTCRIVQITGEIKTPVHHADSNGDFEDESVAMEHTIPGHRENTDCIEEVPEASNTEKVEDLTTPAEGSQLQTS